MKKIALMLLGIALFGVLVAEAQVKSITGTVISSDDDMGIPGVSVSVKGTTIGTVTNLDGVYQLEVPSDAATLIFSFVGMKTQEAPITGSTVNAVMVADLVGIDEVVVTAMGVSRQKKSIGYASTSVGGDEISEAKVVNPMNALQGKVAGVDISSAPGPGATQNVIIRGASSFGSNQPLYVIDGVPITNSQVTTGSALNNNVDFGSGLNAVNPDDIQNMTVLKGAAATALYGSRAANGVILITTKSGTNTGGQMKISYDGSVSMLRVGRIPERQDEFGQGWSGHHALDENGNWGPRYDGSDRVWGYVIDNSQQIKPYSFVESRIRDFYDFGLSHKNSVSASGGNENTTYFMSFSHNNVDGVMPEDVDTYKRSTLSTKGSHKWGKINLTSSVNYSNEKTKAVPSGQGSSVFRSLWEIPEDYSIVDLKDYKSKFNNLNNYFTPYGVNPYFSLFENGSEQVRHKVYGKVQADINITNELLLTYRFGADLESTNTEAWQAKIDIPTDAPSYNDQKNQPGNYSVNKRTRYETNHDAFLNYTKDLSEKLNLNALVGINFNQRGYTRVGGEVLALDVPGYYNLTNGLADPIASQYKMERRLFGAFGNVELGYNDYLYVTLTARNDWSSTLPAGENSYFYPGATASLVLSEMAKKMDMELGVIDFAKARVAYGWTGNDAAPYVIYPVFEKGYVGNPGYPNVDDLELPLNSINSWMISNQLGSPNLAPEITKEFEVGLEMNFFKNRIGFDFSYYNRLTDGLISNQPLDPTSGYTSIVSNIGDVRNKGIEALFFVSPVRTEDFEWKMSFNYSKNKNKVETLAEGEIFLGGFGGAGIVAIEGKEMGLFKTQVTQTVTIDGVEHIVVDGNGMPVATADEVVLEDKSVNEKFRAGFTNDFSYKNWSLAATFDLRYGGYIYSYQKDYMGWTGSGPETVYNNRQPFVIPNSVRLVNGEYVENDIPVASTDLHTFYSAGGFEQTDNFFIDRSYLKLRDIVLAYELPAGFAKRLGVAKIRASVVASNILLWTPKENQYIDPETTTFGNDISAKFGEFGANPTNQSYTFGLSIMF
jgi:TonB-linked SusC/RagA family outer membrane protein